ncbi:hypothetical protein [Sabulibacter ruber]|uniref:hypothetical protein n=1 Tax=Sabulibacter ruber TaxID=2811901 RepID=UPI001A95C49B|nr:hypothetical protein [Sabulibacter ruber]
MPILLTRNVDNSMSGPEPGPCDFSGSTPNVMVEQPVPLGELKARCDRYRQYLASLQPSQEDTMMRAANFTTESVLRLIQQYPASSFIRVYYGIGEDGRHVIFMGAVQGEPSFARTEAEALYVDDCCLCPPRLNCQEDGLLAWQE